MNCCFLFLTVSLATFLPASFAAEYWASPSAPNNGNGRRETPFSSIASALPHLKPGDTLNLRGGTYFGEVTFRAVAGSSQAPITIQSAPGEIAILDSGIPQCRKPDNSDWEPVHDGAPDEWRTTFEVPGTMTGLFLKSGYRLLRYSNANDFRAENQLRNRVTAIRPDEIDFRPGAELIAGRPKIRTGTLTPWIYFGPGIRFNSETKRLHIRLSHTDTARFAEPNPAAPSSSTGRGSQVEVLDYRGETDPRKLGIALAWVDSLALNFSRSSHLVLRNLVVQNSGEWLVRISSSREITFEDVVFHCERYLGRAEKAEGLKFINCEFNGGMPPWSYRSEFKDNYSFFSPEHGEARENNLVRSTSRGLGLIGNLKNVEFAWCEFRNAHDLYLTGKDVRFHHNLVEDIHDDGLFVSSGGEENLRIYQNLLRRTLMGLAFHGDRSGGSRYIYRNVFDLRAPIRSTRPSLPKEGASRIWRSLFIAKMGAPGHFSAYQNTFLFRNNETILGGHQYGAVNKPRQIFNNIFVSLNPEMPIAGAMPATYPAQRDGNLWFRNGETHGRPLFSDASTLEAYRASDVFEASKAHYPPGWEASSLEADPKFASFSGESRPTDDLRLKADSPARRAGVVLPEELEDLLRPNDGSRPDIGAIPFGSEPIRVGRHGRVSLGGGKTLGR